MKRRTRAIVALGTAVAAVVGYLLLRETVVDDYPQMPVDPWLRPACYEFVQSDDVTQCDPATFAVVSPAREAESLARLERSPWVEVSEREAEELAGRPIGGAGGRLVLLRALAWDTPYGGFTVSRRPGAVRVSHGRLGTRPLPVVRRALVARLPEVPFEVFVQLVMAE